VDTPIMMANGLEIRTYRSLDELQTIAASWNELLANYPLATTFSTPEWLMSWWRSFGKDQILLVAGFFSDSRLIALAPLSLSPFRIAGPISLRLLRLMGDGSKDSDNLDLPVRPGFEEKFAGSLLHFLESERNSWDFAQLNTLPPQSPGAHAFRELLRRKEWMAIDKRRPASAIPLPTTWQDYLQRLSAKERGKIGLRTRRLEKKYRVRIRRCAEEGEIDSLLRALYELHGKHWRQRGLPGTLHLLNRRQFYGELSRLLLEHRRLEFWVLELEGKVVAAQFGFRHGTTVFSLQEGFDPDHAADSVGYVLRSHVLKQLIADGVHRYDFLGGVDESKIRWGAQAGHYLDLSFARPFTAGAAYLQAQHYAGRGKSWLRRNLPRTAWELLRKINVGIGRTEGKADPTRNAPEEEETVRDPR
jgi:CelD/BcsL family acetyltransferase involved in cellulose biosynthesis